MLQCLDRNVFIIAADFTLKDTDSRFGAGCFFTLLRPKAKFVIMLSGSRDDIAFISGRVTDITDIAALPAIRRTGSRNSRFSLPGMRCRNYIACSSRKRRRPSSHRRYR